MNGVKRVAPVNVAEFHALRWEGESTREALEWLADRYGWTLGNGRSAGIMSIYGRHKKRYFVREGEWIIALGSNGSLRVCNDRTYKKDYREIEEKA